MGEQAEMMLDGTLCVGCGSYPNWGAGEDFPRYCKDCAKAMREKGHDMRKTGVGGYQEHGMLPTRKVKTYCPTCNKKCNGERGLEHHVRDRHQQGVTA